MCTHACAVLKICNLTAHTLDLIKDSATEYCMLTDYLSIKKMFFFLSVHCAHFPGWGDLKLD
jgi:hypothetical protein